MDTKIWVVENQNVQGQLKNVKIGGWCHNQGYYLIDKLKSTLETTLTCSKEALRTQKNCFTQETIAEKIHQFIPLIF